MSWGIPWGERASTRICTPFCERRFSLAPVTGYLQNAMCANRLYICNTKQIPIWFLRVILRCDFWWRERFEGLLIVAFVNVAQCCRCVLITTMVSSSHWLEMRGKRCQCRRKINCINLYASQLFIPNRIWLLRRGVNHCKSPLPSERRRNDDNLSFQFLTLFG